MIKSLNIELAFKKSNNFKGILRAQPYKKSPVYTHDKYDVIQLQYTFDEEHEIYSDKLTSFYKEYMPTFIKNKNINNKKQHLLETVSYFIAKYFTDTSFDYTKYCISDSYAYFCFSDENDKLVFSAPHITSPILFNPNDIKNKYSLVNHSQSKPFIGYPGNNFTNIHKRTNLFILKYEDTMIELFEAEKRNKVFDMKAIISSLIDYYENKASYSSKTFELKSIYEDQKPTSGLPDILVFSSYELKTFTYESGFYEIG